VLAEQAACLGIAGITGYRAVFVGSDDFPPAVKAEAAAQLTDALVDGSLRSRIAERVPLAEIARAHELVERGAGGRVIIDTSRPS
jgi:NADPH2:quinone reductase